MRPVRMRPTSKEPLAPAPQSDEELVAAIAADRGAPLAALYDRYAGLVYGLALRILADPQEAEDLTQEIFLTLCGKWEYEPSRGTIGAFLVTMTRSRAIDRLRARGRKLRVLGRHGKDPASQSPPSTACEDFFLAERSRHVRDALAQLPDDQRQVLEMAYYRGLSQTEIARQLDAPLGTVKSWSRRALFSLRESLRDLAG